jgi:transposase
LFEALMLMLCQQMPFASVARIVHLSWHRVKAICQRYVNLALDQCDLSDVTAVAFDETSWRRGHEYLTRIADTRKRRVVFVAPGKDADTIKAFAEHLSEHGADAGQVSSVSIDMSPAFIRGVNDHFSNARITFDKFHVVAHATGAVDAMRRHEQRIDPALKGMRWLLRTRHETEFKAR